MAYIRENVNGTTPQDLNKLNENFMTIWQKVFGDIDFNDATNDLKERICTQWIPVQGEGNFDKNNDIKIRFFVPPNTKKIKSSSFNFIAEQYRMDSDVAKGGGGATNVDITLSMGSSNVGVSSVSSPQVAVSSNESTNALITTDLRGISQSKYVQEWGTPSMQKIIPTDIFIDYGDLNPPNDGLEYLTGYWTEHYYSMTIGNRVGILLPCIRGSYNGTRGWYIDSALMQHKHDISHTHTLNVTQTPHKHHITLEPHSHSIALEPHTHNASGRFSLEPHQHLLNEGIKVSTQDIGTIIVGINGVDKFTLNSTDKTKNDIDLTKDIKLGQWNTITVSTNTLARITVYGTIELITKFF